MGKSKTRGTDDTIEQLQLRLIEVEAQIKNPLPDDPFTFLNSGLAKLKREHDVIKKQLLFLLKQREAEEKLKAGTARRPGRSKQEIIHQKIEVMSKRRPHATKTDLFEALAEKLGLETSDRVKKAYYDVETKLKRERDAKARQRRDSEVKSSKEDQREK